ncbi:MAG: SDR family NAD(P)-dependent oxidoreductase [Desulfitobacteriaceae bacterium]
MFDLTGKVVIVTGAGRGIGKGIAEDLSSMGAIIAVNDINGDTARQVTSDIVAKGGKALALPGDVTVLADVSKVVQETVENFGKIDVLINNAGIIGLRVFEEISLAEWMQMFNVHLTGSFLFAQAVIPHMKKCGCGSIINISSNWGQRGAANAVHYSTVKAGLIGFTKALARELAPFNINVNAVAPGPIETEMIEEEARQLNSTVDEVRENLCQTIPLNRLGTIRDVALSVAFLASQAGDFYCGQVIAPNGGEVI